jgi:predicted dinucleotide-binding enzyme
LGSALARNLTADGQKIIVADKTPARAEKLAGELGETAQTMPVADASGRDLASLELRGEVQSLSIAGVLSAAGRGG